MTTVSRRRSTYRLPVSFGTFVELVSLFVVPVLYCGYMEPKLSLASSGNPVVEPWGTEAINALRGGERITP